MWSQFRTAPATFLSAATNRPAPVKVCIVVALFSFFSSHSTAPFSLSSSNIHSATAPLSWSSRRRRIFLDYRESHHTPLSLSFCLSRLTSLSEWSALLSPSFWTSFLFPLFSGTGTLFSVSLYWLIFHNPCVSREFYASVFRSLEGRAEDIAFYSKRHRVPVLRVSCGLRFYGCKMVPPPLYCLDRLRVVWVHYSHPSYLLSLYR